MKTIESRTLTEGTLMPWFSEAVLPICGKRDSDLICLLLSTLIFRDLSTKTIMIWEDGDVEGLATALCGFNKRRYRQIRDDFASRGMIEYVRPKAWKLNHVQLEKLATKAA